MRTPQAAKYLDCSESFLNKLRSAGTGPAFRRAGRAVIYDQPDLDEYKRATRVEPSRCGGADLDAVVEDRHRGADDLALGRLRHRRRDQPQILKCETPEPDP
jgi:hypothetical protein